MPNLNLQPVVQRSMPLSMATEADLRFTAQQALEVIDRNVPGVFVECGVWRGGCSAAMLLAQRERHGTVMRKTYLLDSFQGLPPATERDGPFALAWQADTDPQLPRLTERGSRRNRGPRYASRKLRIRARLVRRHGAPARAAVG
ncbi:MAG: TylF/MycF/NovP-related O-methyltransferase [Actinomycetota bacterium]